jgi:hypothetical protein
MYTKEQSLHSDTKKMVYANTDVAKMPVCMLSGHMYVDCMSEVRQLKLSVAVRAVPLRGRREGKTGSIMNT